MTNLQQPEKIKGLDREPISDLAVVEALNRVPRVKFIPENHQAESLEDRAVPIGCGQTISQPFIVALMSQSLKVTPGMKVLEIGTGSGYQAAVLEELGAEVYSIEIVPELYERASALLKTLGYHVQCRQDDGWVGWKDQVPFDAIIITACCPEIPEPLIAQLRPGGKMVYPIKAIKLPKDDNRFDSDSATDAEELCLLTKAPSGAGYSIAKLGSVRFVPITGLGKRNAAR